MSVQPVAGAPQPVVAAGAVDIQLDSLGLLDFGTLAVPLAVPPGSLGGPIETEIVAMSLVGSSPVFGGNFEIGLNPGLPSLGGILNLDNQSGTLTGDVFFDVFIEINLIDAGMVLSNPSTDHIPLAMSFDIFNGPPEDDVLWMPFFLWDEIVVNTPELQDQFGVPWDTIVTVHTEIPGMSWVPVPAAVWPFGSLGSRFLTTLYGSDCSMGMSFKEKGINLSYINQ